MIIKREENAVINPMYVTREDAMQAVLNKISKIQNNVVIPSAIEIYVGNNSCVELTWYESAETKKFNAHHM